MNIRFIEIIFKILLAGVYGLECYKSQELYFEVEMAKWNVGNTNNNIPESVCSKPCPMGQIKNFEVSSARQSPISNTIYYGIKQSKNMSIDAPLCSLQSDITVPLFRRPAAGPVFPVGRIPSWPERIFV